MIKLFENYNFKGPPTRQKNFCFEILMVRVSTTNYKKNSKFSKKINTIRKLIKFCILHPCLSVIGICWKYLKGRLGLGIHVFNTEFRRLFTPQYNIYLGYLTWGLNFSVQNREKTISFFTYIFFTIGIQLLGPKSVKMRTHGTNLPAR